MLFLGGWGEFVFQEEGRGNSGQKVIKKGTKKAFLQVTGQGGGLAYMLVRGGDSDFDFRRECPPPYPHAHI